MKTELFDVVDQQDRPTGQKVTKQQAHDARLLHRCVAVFVVDAHGDCYAQLHKKSNLLDHSVGGHVRAGESYDAAAYREAAEELGLHNVQLRPLRVGLFSSEYNMQHMFGVYECAAPADWRFVPNAEVGELRLMPIATIVAEMNQHPRTFTPGFINTMHCYLAAKQLPHSLRVRGDTWWALSDCSCDFLILERPQTIIQVGQTG